MPSADTTTTTLATDLQRLGFNHTADQLNDLIAEATRKPAGAPPSCSNTSLATSSKTNTAAASRAGSSAPASDRHFLTFFVFFS